MKDIIIEISKNSESKMQERLAAYARFFDEYSKRGLTPYKISKDTGIATATLSDWKKGISMPKKDKIDTISNYLGVDPDFIIYGSQRNLSDEDALLDVNFSEDPELKAAIKKYYTLDDHKKKHVIELINLLSEN